MLSLTSHISCRQRVLSYQLSAVMQHRSGNVCHKLNVSTPFSAESMSGSATKPLGLLLVQQQQQSRRLAAMRRSLSTKLARNRVTSTTKLVATQMVA